MSLLTAQNTALKKNLSCLYKTAKLEIDRKAAEIARLRGAPPRPRPYPAAPPAARTAAPPPAAASGPS